MTMDELFEMWKVDGKIDAANLGTESIRVPELHNKYFILYAKSGLKVKKLKSDLLELENAKTEYYSGAMDIEEIKQRGWEPMRNRIIRQDVPRHVEADKDIIRLSLTIAYHDSMTKYLEDIVKQINNRNFYIKNAIEFAKFQSGGH